MTVPCPRLVGRDKQVATLVQALDSAAHGDGRALLLVGEAGVGKSRLLRSVADEAARRGMPVLAGRAVEPTVPALRPLTEALLSYLRRVEQDIPTGDPFGSVLGWLLPGWAGGPAERPHAGVVPVVLGEAVLRLLRTVAGRSCCLLALEDVHWADPETLAVIEYLADNLAGEPLLLLLTVRDDEPTEPVSRLRVLAARRAVTTVEVRRLDAADAETLAAACLERDTVPASVRDLVAGAEGLPFLVEELLAAADPGARHQSPVPRSFADTVRRRLGASPGATEVLRAAALLGRRFDTELLAEITGLSGLEVTAALRGAAGHRIVEVDTDGRLQFRHALTRAAILADLLPAELVTLAGRALPAVETAHPRLPGEWCELAAELADAAGQADRAAALFLEAGRRALGHGALITAGTHLDRARHLAGDDRGLAVDADDALCAVLALAGDNARLAEVGRRLFAGLAEVGASPVRVAAAHRRLARAAIAASDWTAAEHHLHDARTAAGSGPDPEADVLAAQVALGRDEPRRAIELARRALGEAEVQRRAELACDALEVIGRRERTRDLAAAEQAFAAALDWAQRSGSAVWRIRALHELGTLDLLTGRPVDRLAEARAAALTAGALSTAATVGLQMAAWHLNRADAEAAVRTAREFAAEAHRLRMPVVAALGSVIEAAGHALAGRRVAMDTALTAARALAGEDAEVRGVAALQVRAAYWLVREDRVRALAELDAGMVLLRETAVTAPFRGMWALVHAVENRDGAAAVAEVEASGLTVYWLVRGWAGHAWAVELGRAGRPGEAVEAFTAADAALAPCPWYQQHARRLVAEAALADGWGEPAVWLTGALGFFDGTGDDRIASACRALLRRARVTVPRRRRPAADAPAHLQGLGLTGREIEVLALLAEARPTRDIAAQLFLSPKTVERHVANLAAKVGVSGRAELIAFAAKRMQPSP